MPCLTGKLTNVHCWLNQAAAAAGAAETAALAAGELARKAHTRAALEAASAAAQSYNQVALREV